MTPPDMSGISQTLGVDLGAQPEGTAACRIEWSLDGGRVLPGEEADLSIAFLRELISDRDVSHVAIDAPFGWPSAFVDAVTGYRATGTWTAADQLDLKFRKTELYIKDVTGKYPLSVTAGYLVYLGWRCAEVFSEVPEWSIESRRGEGRLIEVYPAGSLHHWGISPKTWVENPGPYKGDSPESRERRERLVALIGDRCQGRLDLDGQEHRFIDSDHELDALIAALTARAVSVGLAEPTPEDSDATVLQEGWIRLPKLGSSLAEVCG